MSELVIGEKMIVFNHGPVVKAEAMIRASPGDDGGFFEQAQAGGGFASVEKSSPRASDGFDVTLRKCGHAGETLQKIQRHAFGGHDCTCGTRNPEHGIAGEQSGAIAEDGIYLQSCIHPPENFRSRPYSSEHGGFLDKNTGLGMGTGCDEKLSGYIARSDILGECGGNGVVHGAKIYRYEVRRGLARFRVGKKVGVVYCFKVFAKHFWIFSFCAVLVFTLASGCKKQASPAAEKPMLTIAAASDLKFALDHLADEFRKKHPAIGVQISYGSSGNFFAQIQNGAPFDLYFSADIEYPRGLAAAGRALDDAIFPYAIGHLVLWVKNESPLDLGLGMQVLRGADAKKIAIANPQHAPYGRATVAALRSLGVYEQVESRLVYGENIAQTAQFVESGAAEIGVLALSLALSPRMKKVGRYLKIPTSAHPPLEQGGMILRSTQQPEAARRFRDFVLAPEGRQVLEKYGFQLPQR